MQIVITLEIYGVKKIVGIPYGYRGFSDKELAEMPVSSCLCFYEYTSNHLIDSSVSCILFLKLNFFYSIMIMRY